MMYQHDSLTIERVSNGWLVTGPHSWQNGDRPTDAPPHWHVFETFGALVEHLAKRWPPKAPA
jgi:hypothetical protein